MAYQLDLPPTAHIHDVVHVSQLKKHIPPKTQVYSNLSLIRTADSPALVPSACLDRILVKQGKAVVVHVLVKWQGWPDSFATWESLHKLEERYPSVRAWGQAAS